MCPTWEGSQRVAKKNPEQNPRRVGSNKALIPGNPGNSGGKKGRSGRKPFPWKELCRDILHDAATQETIRRAAQNPETRGYAALLKLLADHSEGVPVQQVRVTTDGDTLDGILSRMARAQAAGGAGHVDPVPDPGPPGAAR